MASLEWNKAMAAVLTAGVLASGAGVVSRILYQPEELEEPAYQVAGLEEGAAGGEGADAEAEGLQPIAPLLAAASVEEGQGVAKKCTACHAFEAGAPNKIGPMLWGVVARDIAGLEDFAYSEALASKEGVWDYEALNGFLHDPQEWAPGTKMTFAGLSSAEDRANIIAYLRTLAETPEPLPEVTEEPAAAAAEEPGAEVAAATEAGGAAGAGGSIGPLLAAASVEEGEAAVRKCSACHSFDEGGPNKVGPALWDVVGRDIAGVEGFNYSDALQEKEGAWDYQPLDAFLEDPQAWAPGTKMAFPGIKKPEERANVIAYLRSLSENPAPLPDGG